MVYRFPRRLMDKEDPEVLGDLMQKPNPLVTTDLEMVRQHLAFIPDFHPGILTISNSKNPQTITSKGIRRILAKLKELFPLWHQADFRNSIAEITPESIELSHVEGGSLIRDKSLSFDTDGWVSEAEVILAHNAPPGTRIEGGKA
ncbi:MAG: hypothetical protein ACLQGP_27530 [Isosphaeraceae bacterium]